MLHRLLILTLLPSLFAADPVVHRTPVAASVFPQGARPGQTIDAEILGEFLDNASQILVPSRAFTASLTSHSPTRLTLRINTPASAPYGTYVLYVISPRGASNPVLLRIGDLPHILESEPNSVIDDAQITPIPATILGRLNTDGDFDFFRFHAARGSRWLFDLRAARNGNSLDAALILLDANGRKLAHCEERFIWDPFLEYQFAEEGDYIVVVQPTHRFNDPNFAYSLDIRQSPHIDTIAPLALEPGDREITLYGAGFQHTNAKLEFSNPTVTGQLIAVNGATARAKLHVPELSGPQALTLITPEGRSNTASFLIDPTPTILGANLKAPAQVTAMARYRDPHKFTIDAKAGESLTFEVRSQRFGADSDLSMRLLSAQGKTIASNDDFNFAGEAFYQKDPRLTHKFAESGTYTLELRNTVAVPSEGTPFQLTVSLLMPRFTPQLSGDHPYIYPGETKKWKVTVQRLDGHHADIPVTVEGLPAAITAKPAVIPSGKNEADIELTAASNAEPATAANIIVKTGAETAWRNVRISSGGGEGATYARVGSAILTVARKPNFSLEATASVVNIPRGGTAKIPISIRREPGFEEPISFRINNLPSGVTMDPLTVPASQSTLEITIRAAQSAAQARAPRVAILGITNGEQQEAPRISILVN
ncbi:MAG: hypothetical protein HYX27_20265 [Acidobacteria bacterium]|nr:hypothetical protein [Acidobacteriota bacterium]